MDELTRALLPVVADPEQVSLLYARLREFCHDIRNKLSVYRIQIYLAKRDAVGTPPKLLPEIEARYNALERFVLEVQSICRPMQPMLMPISLDTLLKERSLAWTDLFARRGRTLRWSPPPVEVTGNLDPCLLSEALESFVTWRAEVGPPCSVIQIRWRADRGLIQWSWHEPRAVGGSSGQGGPCGGLPCLALAMLGRVLATHGGSLSVDDRAGFDLEVRLPVHHAKAPVAGSALGNRDFHAHRSAGSATRPIHLSSSSPARQPRPRPASQSHQRPGASTTARDLGNGSSDLKP